MSDRLLARNPLHTFLQRGVPSKTGHAPGLFIEERQDTIQLQLLARNQDPSQLSDSITRFLGRTSPLSAMEGAMHDGLFICATGPREYWILAQNPDAINAITALQDMVEQSASVFDQSAGRIVVQMTGANAIDVLAKGTALDLQAKALPAQGATHTVLEHIPALLAWQSNAVVYDLSLPRSYAHSFMTWFCSAAREYCYSINAIP